jgi:hypothetical protein
MDLEEYEALVGISQELHKLNETLERIAPPKEGSGIISRVVNWIRRAEA